VVAACCLLLSEEEGSVVEMKASVEGWRVVAMFLDSQQEGEMFNQIGVSKVCGNSLTPFHQSKDQKWASLLAMANGMYHLLSTAF
jgi:hypothetical protein